MLGSNEEDLLGCIFSRIFFSSRWTLFYLLEMSSASNNKRSHGSSFHQILFHPLAPSILCLFSHNFLLYSSKIVASPASGPLARQESTQGKTSSSPRSLSLSGKDEPSLVHMPMSQGHHITHSGERGLGSLTLQLLICVT